MTDSSQEQKSQSERHQQKWQKFADNLRHSVDTDQCNGGNVEDQQPTYDSTNGLKSPVLSEEQQSDLGTESSNGVAEDGFELVINKRNRSQKQKQVNGSVWAGNNVPKDSHLSSNTNVSNTPAPPTTQHSTTNTSTQSTKLRVTSATNTTASANPKNAQNKNLTTKTSPYGLIRCMEEGAAENEQEKDMSNSSDSAFAENQSPSHGSSTSLHFIGASENQTFSDSVALSDDEKWPELSVATKNDVAGIKSTTSPSSPKTSETIKSTTPVDESPLEKDAALNRRGQRAQWKKVDVEFNYGKTHEKKHGSSKRNFRSQGNLDGEAPQRRNTVGSYNNKRRPHSRKSNLSSSDVESQNNNEVEKSESHNKAETTNDSSSNSQSKAGSHRQHLENGQQNSYGRRDNKSNDQNGRGYRNNNNYRQDQHYNDYGNRRQNRNPRVARHSVPNLLQCQTALPVYFLSQDYAGENYIQPLASTQAGPQFIYPNMTNVILPTPYPEMTYASPQFLNDYGQQNIFQYRAPFVQLPMMPQNAPFISTTVASIPESMPIPESTSGEQNLEEELSQLLRRFFIDDNEKTLRDLTENPNIIAQLNFSERCLLLRCQMQFYFSNENLAKDVFLRRHMDDERFVPLGLFLTFPRIKNLGLDSNTIVNGLAHSEHFELRINEQDVKIRAKSLSQGWPSGNNLSNNASPSNTVPSPPQSDNVSQTKRPSQAPTEDISVDDVRARLIQGIHGRSKPSSPLAENEAEESSSPSNHTVANEQEEEKQQHDDKWVVYKNKKRQPSANGSVTESDSKFSSKPPIGKPAAIVNNNSTTGVKSPRSARQ